MKLRLARYFRRRLQSGGPSGPLGSPAFLVAFMPGGFGCLASLFYLAASMGNAATISRLEARVVQQKIGMRM